MRYSDSFLRKLRAVLFFLLIVNVAACASVQTDYSAKGDGKSLFRDNGTSIVVKSDDVKYSDLLVNIKNYSTNGGLYQSKYEKLLLTMAREIVEGQDLDVSKESIGFYYDKKSQRTDRLFFGVDINTVREGNLDYGRFSVKLIKENVSEIVDLMYKYNAILSENEIVGVVIGFKWLENNTPQQVNIWIKKEDLHLFYEGKILLNEMYQRSTVTNSVGKIILLPI